MRKDIRKEEKKEWKERGNGGKISRKWAGKQVSDEHKDSRDGDNTHFQLLFILYISIQGHDCGVLSENLTHYNGKKKQKKNSWVFSNYCSTAMGIFFKN